MNKEVLYKQWENEFYDKFGDHEILQEFDFEGIAMGFFIGKGLDVDESLKMYQHCIKNNKF